MHSTSRQCHLPNPFCLCSRISSYAALICSRVFSILRDTPTRRIVPLRLVQHCASMINQTRAHTETNTTITYTLHNINTTTHIEDTRHVFQCYDVYIIPCYIVGVVIGMTLTSTAHHAILLVGTNEFHAVQHIITQVKTM